MEDNKIVQINGEKFIEEEIEEDDDLCPMELLKDVADVDWEKLTIIGVDKKDQLHVYSNIERAADLNLLLDRSKQKLLEILD